jgi:hypothetical protein
MKLIVSILFTLFSFHLLAGERVGQVNCRDYFYPDNYLIKKFIGNNMQVSGELCNREVKKYAIKKLTNAHLCRDLKLDPSLQAKVRRKPDCDEILSPINYPAGCESALDDETKDLVKIHKRLSLLEKDSSPQQLHDELLSIYINRLVLNGERAPGRGTARAYITNNLPSIAFGLIYENTGSQLSKKTDYLVCIEQAYRFLDSDTPESKYLLFKGYTLDLYDETPKSDEGDQVTHAYTQLTSPEGKHFVFDSWKGVTKEFDSEVKSKDSKGIREAFRRKPLKGL